MGYIGEKEQITRRVYEDPFEQPAPSEPAPSEPAPAEVPAEPVPA